MHVVITGGAGFLGIRLARALLERGTLSLAGAVARPIEHLTLVDRAAPPQWLQGDPRVRAVAGDLVDLLEAEPTRVVPADTAAVIHLASAVSGECEADFDLGMRSNLRAGMLLLERCRALGTAPLLVFSSSLAVFGAAPGRPLPEVVTDDTLPLPQSSYGVQKYVLEQLVADFTRKGFVRGRSVRLMTVSVRPGRPNGAASGFLSGIIREPLAGVRSTCPVPPDTPVALSSPARAIEGLMCALHTDDRTWGGPTAFNLPALTTTPARMAAALERVAGNDVAGLIDWQVEPAIERIVAGWPSRFDSARVRALGLQGDADFEAVIRDYVRENPEAVKMG